MAEKSNKAKATPTNNAEWKDAIQNAKAKEEAKKKEEVSVEESMKNLEKKKEETQVEEKKEEVKEENKEEFSSYFNPEAGSKPVNNPDYVPTLEEQAREKKCKEDKRNDASEAVQVIIGTSDQIEESLEYIASNRSKLNNISKEDIEKDEELKKLSEWSRDIRNTERRSMRYDNQKDLLISMIDALNAHGTKLEELDKKLSISKINTELTGKPRRLSGEEAKQLIYSRYRGVFKVQLHNSGFWIKIVPMDPADLDAWIQSVDDEGRQLGRIVGGYFYLGLGVYLKQAMEHLLSCTVVDSNLQNWREGTNLVDSISIQDYDTLCWAYSTIMHRDGITITTICSNPECKHKNTSHYIDLARCSFINPKAYTKEAMVFMMEGNAPGVIRSKEVIENYRTKLLGNVRLININKTDQLELKDPSLGDYIRTGMKLLGEVAAAVNKSEKEEERELTADNDKARREVANRLASMLSPWISRVICKTDDGNVSAIIEDREAIVELLDTILADNEDFMKNYQQFITESKATFYGYVNARCPKCGRQMNLLTDNITPMDMEYILFCLSYLRLGQIGRTM